MVQHYKDDCTLNLMLKDNFEICYRVAGDNDKKEEYMVPCICSQCTKAEIPHYFELSELHRYLRAKENMIKCSRSIESQANSFLEHPLKLFIKKSSRPLRAAAFFESLFFFCLILQLLFLS